MKLLNLSLTHEFNQYVPFKVSFTMRVIVFFVSTRLQLVFMYVCHRYNLGDHIFPKSSTKTNAIKPVLQVPKECSPTVSPELSNRYHFLLSNEDILAKVDLNSKPHTIRPQKAASFFSVASQCFSGNVHVTENIESQQDGHYATIEKKQQTPA